ncbi:MAG: hypothetical protein LZF60_260032 [Nitrospira sp.]|nr:MAG: hypothetical protein LZF60_260032 [Nitrospira sp.]
MRHGNIRNSWCSQGLIASVIVLAAGLTATGCARLPYTTKTVHEDERVVVNVQREVEPRAYTHPIQLSAADLASILRGFSIREQQRLPLRWFAEEVPPKPLFREDEAQALAPYLADALQHVAGNERAHFEVRGPGNNPRYSRDVVAGWVAVRDPYLYLKVEYFHNQIPIRRSDNYDYNYPLTPPTPRDYILYFEPGRFWLSDDKEVRGVEYRQFLKSAESGGAAPR